MPITSLTQAERANTAGFELIHLVEIALESTTLRFSDRPYSYTYSTTTLLYEDYLVDIDGLGEFSRSGQIYNANVTLKLSNEPWGGYDYLYLLDADQQFQRAAVAIYELRVVQDGETFASDVRTCLWKGNVEQITDLGMDVFTLRCCSRIHNLRDAMMPGKITRDRYPYPDPNEIGRYRNRPFGRLEKVPCRLVYTGAVDLLNVDISASATSITVSGIAQLDFPASGTIQIDDEQISYTGWSDSTYTFSGCTRGASSTTATTHKSGAPVYLVLSLYVYEVSQEPVYSIGDVFVDGVRQVKYPTSGYTVRAYTGKTGDQYAGTGAAASLVFNIKPVVKKQINVSVTSEHGHSTDTGSHAHSTSAVVVWEGGVSSYDQTGVTNPGNIYDGNGTTYATLSSSSTGNHITFSMVDGSSYGTLTKVIVRLLYKHDASANGNKLDVIWKPGAGQVVLYSSAQQIISASELAWAVTSELSWTNTIKLGISSGTGTNDDYEIYNLKVEYHYTPKIASGAATGVSASVSGSSVLGGLTTADVVVGTQITADCWGVCDDASGTITGVANGIIESPAFVFRYLFYNVGIALGDIDYSGWTTQWFNYGIAAFLMHDLGGDGLQVIDALLQQFRGCLTDWAGVILLEDDHPVDEVYDFRGWSRLFSAYHATITNNADSITLTANDSDPMLYLESLMLYGGGYSTIRVRMRRIAGTGWDGTVYYATAGHTYASGYRKTIAEPALSAWTEVDWDMADLTSGGDDWTTHLVTGVRFDFGTTSGDSFEIDWVKFVHDYPLASDFVVEEDDLVELPRYSRGALHEVKSLVHCFYRRDYREGGGPENNFWAGMNPDAIAAGYMDMLAFKADSQDLVLDLYANAVNQEAYARSLGVHTLLKRQDSALTAEFVLNWRAIQIRPGMIFTYVCPMLGSRMWRAVGYQVDRVGGKILVQAEWVEWI